MYIDKNYFKSSRIFAFGIGIADKILYLFHIGFQAIIKFNFDILKKL